MAAIPKNAPLVAHRFPGIRALLAPGDSGQPKRPSSLSKSKAGHKGKGGNLNWQSGGSRPAPTVCPAEEIKVKNEEKAASSTSSVMPHGKPYLTTMVASSGSVGHDHCPRW